MKHPINKLKKEADKWFSRYIRLRDSDPHTEMGNCCTCGTPLHWKSGDAGHFQQRYKNITRYEEKNSHLQCKQCNNKDWKQGEQYLHGKFIDNKYGEGTADYLSELGKQKKQFKPYELEELIDLYKQKIKDLEGGGYGN
jgi:hypothetical protein